ncbi:MAG: biopolymer transporter ExbD [Lentisphaeria bacterium]|nr:biopolymer transporter ExbD [Lentisphaeria bacterium]NQZ66895.1 biopolymer transporter ExbD [Lentisphaeria bacterium]
MRLNLDDNDEINVDMGPLLDCVFLLLIFFLVATILKKPEEELPINLPEPAVAAVKSDIAQAHVIGIGPDGTFYLDAIPVGQAEIHKKIISIAKRNKAAYVRFDVDQQAPSSYLIQVLDLCAFEGLTNYNIHTKTPEDIPKKPKGK